MKRHRTTRRHFLIESLEDRTVMATGLSASIPTAVPGATVFAQIGVPTAGTVNSTDAAAIQQDIQYNTLEIFLSETELLAGSNAGAQQYARMMVAMHSDALFALETLAQAKGVSFGSGLTGQNAQVADYVLAAANSKYFDQSYEQAMIISHATAVNATAAQMSAAQDPQFMAYLQATQPVNIAHLNAALSLYQGGSGTITMPAPLSLAPADGATPYTPGMTTFPTAGSAPTSTLSAGDTTILQSLLSGGASEAYMSQLAALVHGGATGGGAAGGPLIAQYADIVVNGHSQSDFQIEQIAFQTNTSIQPGLQSPDDSFASETAATLKRSYFVGSGLNTSSATAGQGGTGVTGTFDKAYLSAMAQLNSEDIQQGQQYQATAQNAQIQSTLQSDNPINQAHLQAAQILLNGYGFSTGSGGTGTGTGGTGTGTGGTGTGTTTGSTAQAAFVTRLYNNVFNRNPASSETSFWVNALSKGTSPLAVYTAFIDTASGYGQTGGTTTDPIGTNQAFVNSLYPSILGTSTDPNGAALWVNDINNGTSRNAILVDFANIAGIPISGGSGTSNGSGSSSGTGNGAGQTTATGANTANGSNSGTTGTGTTGSGTGTGTGSGTNGSGTTTGTTGITGTGTTGTGTTGIGTTGTGTTGTGLTGTGTGTGIGTTGTGTGTTGTGTGTTGTGTTGTGIGSLGGTGTGTTGTGTGTTGTGATGTGSTGTGTTGTGTGTTGTGTGTGLGGTGNI